MKTIRALFLNQLFFYALLCIIMGFVLAFVFPALYMVVWYLLLMLLVFLSFDVLILFIHKDGVVASRIAPEKLSNGDENQIDIKVINQYVFTITIKIIDEIPFQFQVRNFKIRRTLGVNTQCRVHYFLRPTQRGDYSFGHVNIYASSPLRLVSRRFTFNDPQVIPTYPSYIQLRKYNLMAFSNTSHHYGLKKIRRIGHTVEFEQIKDYVQGDDMRTINWKATAKKKSFMVNQFQDEKSQQVYMILDMGRVMKMPFNGLSLLDYAINTTLVLSSVILRKEDKVGILAFSKKVEQRVVAEKRSSQMQKILESLYNIKTDFFESDFGCLYADVKRNINQRSLILLYTNFETLDNLYRQLSYLQGLAKNHLLVVIFFQNTALQDLIDQEPKNMQEIYDQFIAEKFAFEKRLIVNELKKYGIHSILTQPEHLTPDTINKYLEIKSRGIL